MSQQSYMGGGSHQTVFGCLDSLHTVCVLAAQYNQQSLSNGCLMRVTPLAVWGHKQPVQRLAQLVQEETALTHPNTTAQVRARAVRCGSFVYVYEECGQGALSWSGKTQNDIMGLLFSLTCLTLWSHFHVLPFSGNLLIKSTCNSVA